MSSGVGHILSFVCVKTSPWTKKQTTITCKIDASVANIFFYSRLYWLRNEYKDLSWSLSFSGVYIFKLHFIDWSLLLLCYVLSVKIIRTPDKLWPSIFYHCSNTLKLKIFHSIYLISLSNFETSNFKQEYNCCWRFLSGTRYA